ncbi:YceI family protein [Streptomyces sp. NPDC001920]
MTTTTQLSALTGGYVLDTTRSRIGFTARAMMISKVPGQFDVFEGRAHLDGATPSKSTVQLTIRAASVQTRNTKRDDHLRGTDFLDAVGHPTITFVSTRVEQVDETEFKVTGDLAVRGITKPVTVDFRLTDTASGAAGTGRVRLTGSATINRKDWGVDGGTGMVGAKVALSFDVIAVRQP